MDRFVKLVGTLAFCAGFAAHAQPVAETGTEGFKLVVDAPGEVWARYEGSSAGYSNDLYYGDRFLFGNATSTLGSTVLLGTFNAGDELVLRMHVNNTGDNFFSGGTERNPDLHDHARVQTDWEPGRALVSFEDLHNGPFTYNDLSASFSNTVGIQAVFEPGTALLLLAGLSGMALRRRIRPA